MSTQNSQGIRIPAHALEEFEIVENFDWEEGVTLSDLVNWINVLEDEYRPLQSDARIGGKFTERSLRHYQTLGCIDSPTRVGKRAMYGFRQYLQALLIRKLLWEKVSSEQIVTLMEGKSNEEYKALIFEGIEIVTRPSSSEATAPAAPVHQQSGAWQRYSVGSGIELHVNENCGLLSQQEVKSILSEVERHLRS